MDIRKQYRRFKAWQLKPFRYRNKGREAVRCANCGNEFTANFCPVCGQKAGVGRITWEAVRQGIMLLWGMESRSLLYTLLQLLLRPGYLISDYISGRRQVSYPPVKMLFIVAIVQIILDNFMDKAEPKALSDSADLLSRFGLWLDQNPGWMMLLITSSMLLPTWFSFRWAPRHTRHTLPEGFFIQVFMATLFAIIIVFTTLYPIFILLFPVYYVITYHRLFGYGIWGTLWRLAACLFLVVQEVYLLLVIVQYFKKGIAEVYENTLLHLVAITVFTLLTLLLVAGISKYTAKKAGR